MYRSLFARGARIATPFPLPPPGGLPTVKRVLTENGLSLTLFFLFFVTFIAGQSIAGHREYLGDQEGLPGELGTPEGEAGPSELDPETATGAGEQ